MFEKTDSTGPITQAARAVLPQTPQNPLVAAYRSANTNDPWRMAASQNADTGSSADPFTKATRSAQTAQNPLVVAMSADRSNATTYAATPANGERDAVAPGLQERTFTSGNPLLKSHPANSFAETGTTTDSLNPLTTINLQANNESMARANAIRQSTGEGDGPKVAMLGDSGRAESQALMDKWGREDQVREMVQEMGRNPKAAGAIASLMNTQQGSETARAGMENNQGIAALENDTRRRGQDVAMRGQDVEAQTRATQLAGNPLANELTRARIDSERLSADTMRRQNGVLSQLENETDPAKRETLIENALAAQGKSLPQTERLTLEQMRTNREIQAARKMIAGLSPIEIQRKTAKQTNTGRENPEFDPALERAVSLAARRKIGEDDEFDRRSAQESPSAAPTTGDVATRFSGDPAMKNHRLGKQTDQGTEVFDASGTLIGHYQ